MRGLKPLERTMLDEIIAAGTCVGEAPGRPYSDAELKAVDDLVHQGRAVLNRCTCGKSHMALTSAGLEARRLDKLASLVS